MTGHCHAGAVILLLELIDLYERVWLGCTAQGEDSNCTTRYPIPRFIYCVRLSERLGMPVCLLAAPVDYVS